MEIQTLQIGIQKGAQLLDNPQTEPKAAGRHKPMGKGKWASREKDEPFERGWWKLDLHIISLFQKYYEPFFYFRKRP